MYLNFVGALLTKSEVHQQICIVFQSPSRVKSRLISISLTRKGLDIKDNEFDSSWFMHASHIFVTRNNLNHVSGRDSLWYMTSNLCDLLMDKDPITQDEMNFFDVCVFLGNERDIVLVKEKFRVASCYPFE